jgi:microcystin-dependent protein
MFLIPVITCLGTKQLPLESATYISDLVTSNPAASDGLNNADDHMRLIKSALKATFPSFTAAALNSTQAQIDAIATLMVSGVLRGNGAVPAGAIQDFGMTTAPTGWLACDGTSVPTGTYPDLFAAIGYTWGGSGANFNVPDLRNRFRRHRNVGSLAGAVTTLQGPANLAHTHGVSATTGTESADHAHAFSGTTGAADRSLDHTHGNASASYNGSSTGGGAYPTALTTSANTGSADRSLDHLHSFSGATGGRNAAHTHFFSTTSTGGSADDGSEARPYSATVLTCIKA